MHQITHEIIRNHQNEAHEREKMALRFEIELLRSGRQLPVNPPPDKE